MPCLCHVKQHLICGVVIQLQLYNCVSEFRFRLNWISCIAPSLPCHAYHLHHAGSSAVVVRLHPMCVPAFASSRIGSRSGVVRYDEFTGSSSATFHRRAHLFTYFTISVSLISCYPYVCDSVVSRVLFHLLPIWAVFPLRHLSPLLVGWALRVVAHV